MSEPIKSAEFKLPALHELANDLTRISPVRRTVSLSLPFLWITLYFVCAIWRWWPLAVICLICLSFVTYGSVSHDLVHGNLGFHKRTNSFLLLLIELLALRSGHAYRMVHLHHHACYPHDDDIEGAAAKMSLLRTLLEGTIFQFRIWWWAVKHTESERFAIVLEGVGVVTLVLFSVALTAVTPIFLVYVVLMIMGSWIIPLVTPYVPHEPHGENELSQTRLFRGKVASFIAVEHLYHLEHHLYPSVPHHHWPELGRRLDPYFEQAGIKPIKLWF